MNDIISLDLYFTDFITKKDRREIYKSQFKSEYQDNAIKLLLQVNALLNDLGIKTTDVTSGWRPESVNIDTPNAAPHSAHMIGLAIDILDDKDQNLAKLVSSRPELLRQYNLFQENPTYTKGKNTNWCHLDIVNRPDRPSRQFIP